MKINKCWGKKSAFTLVELIVVITILAILWTIAFISFQWFKTSARDSARISDLRNIEKWLELIVTKDVLLPEPAEKITITNSWETIWYQWKMTKNLAWTIWVNWELVDPLTQANYIYSVDKNFKKYQVLWYLENSKNTAMLKNNNFLVNTTYAEEIKYTDKYLITYGNEVWIILNKDNSPVITSSINIDCNTKNDYKLVLSETKSFDSISWQNMYSWALCYDAEYERDPAFTTTWKVWTTWFWNADNTIKFTLSYVWAWEIEWWDWEKTAISTSFSTVTHTYASAWDYTVKIRW